MRMYCALRLMDWNEGNEFMCADHIPNASQAADD